MHRPVLLFTDFTLQGPYVGELHLTAWRLAPQVPLIDLMHDAPSANPHAAAYLLDALALRFPADAVVVGVVDPGVGSPRAPVVLQALGCHFVGPDNGLFSRVAARDPAARWQAINWRPHTLSTSFHGRDLFLPAALKLARRQAIALGPHTPRTVSGPEQLAEIIYIDGFGNAMTGLQAAGLPTGAGLRCQGRMIPHARTFADVPVGSVFWFENSLGLAELAVNQGHAARQLSLRVGTALGF